MYERYIKRALDVVLSAVGLVALSPLLALIALAIRLDSPGPVVFHQKRFGKDRKLFEIYKFRTMRVDAPRDVPTNDLLRLQRVHHPRGAHFAHDQPGRAAPALEHPEGRYVAHRPPARAVESGGPDGLARPLRASHIRPGLSGWAQVNGRDYLSRDLEKKARRRRRICA